MKSAVIFGAGAIGLAFLGDLLDQSQYRMTFVDVREAIIRWLREKGEYSILVTDGRSSAQRRIGNVRALNSRDYGKDEALTDALREEIAGADILFTAAGEGALKAIGRVIGDALRVRVAPRSRLLNIVCCENIKDPGSILRQAILTAAGGAAELVSEHVGICRSVISRMTPVVTEPVNIVTEPYAQIPVEGAPWLGPLPDIVGVRLVANFEAYKMQKLIMHNMTHAVAAYLGYLLDKKDICDCVSDPLIAKATRGALDESQRIMRREYGLPEDELREHAEDLFRRYDNPALGHTVANVARDPLRKLVPGDRFHSALTLAEKNGVVAKCAEVGVVCALLYDNPEDISAPRLQELLKASGMPAFMNEQMGIKPDGPLGRRVQALYTLGREAVAAQRSAGSDESLRRFVARAIEEPPHESASGIGAR
jgi:mannitol-1-phosphate 5-dehydrogenase